MQILNARLSSFGFPQKPVTMDSFGQKGQTCDPSDHSAIMGRARHDWQGTRYVPACFGDSVKAAGKPFDHKWIFRLSNHLRLLLLK
jgi:hypothetical protein